MSRRNTIVSNLSAINMRAYSPLHLTGVAPVATSQLRSVYFNGTDQSMVAVSPAMQTAILAQNYTITMWIKPESQAGRKTLLWAGDTTRRIYFNLMEGNTLGMMGSVSTPVLPLNTWQFVAAAKGNDQAVKFYIDGVYAGTKNKQISNCGTADMFVGGSVSGTQLYKGYVTQIAYYDIALPASSLLAMYNEGTPLNDLLADSGNYTHSGNLVGWWPLSNTFADLSPNNTPFVPSGDIEFFEDLPVAAA
jgi:hypothetical protein